jgi:hypothetical protein
MAAEKTAKKKATRSTQRVPRVLWSDDETRIVLLEDPDVSTGPRFAFEYAEGRDAVGNPRWQQLDETDAAALAGVLDSVATWFATKPRRRVKRGTK